MCVGAHTLFMSWDPNAGQESSQYDLRLRLKNEGDPEEPPPARPGDGWVMLGLIAGMIVGAAGGGLAGSVYHVSVLATILGGVLVGALVGTLLGDRIRKLVLARRQRAAALRPRGGGAVHG